MSERQQAAFALTNVQLLDPSTGLEEHGAILIEEGKIKAIGANVAGQLPTDILRIDGGGKIAAPGLVDMHVTTGEPGAEHRETLKSASKAAAAGGVTSIACMPDTDPVIDDIALVDFITRRARDTARVHVHPYAAMTRGLAGKEMTEIGLMLQAGAVALSNGRKAITNAQIMRRVMTYAHDFDALIVHHPEDPDLVGNGVMNLGETSTRLGLPGIPAEAETIMVARDIRLAQLTGCRYHAGQISCAESLEIIRRAKDKGLDVTCGVSINHLTLNENDIGLYRTFYKMSPPLRSEDERQAMIAGVADGTIDVIVSAHDPQDVDTKRHPFAECADGAVGLETMLAATMRLVHNDQLTLMQAFKALSTTPASLLRLKAGSLQPGLPADVILFDPNEPWVMDRDDLKSRSKNTAFHKARFSGRVLQTYVEGQLVHHYDPK
ncbi:dihydroorotase [Cohaesibacter celericrescens]|uniref:Dihydroorotase n=1 Tax=Cohaesibacter celericrescens TaxID=2067669 RepID=A0A2N5XS47_9HYPH|nr:dihydroorotase [Cohaesibacter celericrescens]PLW77314.1 dihydroorotase [Cohaesibacter celericrescens]